MSRQPRSRILPSCIVVGLTAGPASTIAAAPLPLYDTARESTALAPIAPASPCGGFAVACSAAPVSPQHVLPFDYGLAVSGGIGGSSRGAFSGVGVSGWVKPKDVPVSLYFDFERLQPIGRTR